MAEIVRLERKGEVETTYEDDDLLKRLKQDFKAAEDMSSDWRQEAVELYDLVAGDQWSEVDKMRLADQLRPALTFNMMEKYINAVGGIQIANRMDMTFIPREEGDVGLNELMTNAADYYRDECSAYAEESEAWRDMLITGMGATETFLEFDDDPDGTIKVERRDPCEIYIDPSSRQMNCLDARYMQRIKFMAHEEGEDRWGDKWDEVQVGQSMGIEPTMEGAFDNYIHHANEAWKYEHTAFGEIERRRFPVIEYQWWKRDKMHRIITQMGTRDVTPAQWVKLKSILEAQNIPFRERSYKARKYFRAFACGGVILQKGESPYQGGFTYALMTGKRDRNSNSWYGIGRSLAEPQKFINKILSEALYILTTQAKGGLMAEEDAFIDPKRAEDQWASPDSIVWMEQGAIQAGKVMPKPTSGIPGGFDKFLSFAMDSMPETSGLNLEIMGLTNKVQPGIVESQRKEAAISMIQWAFDSLKRYYEVSGRIMGEYLREYVSDGRLIRITGDEEDRKYIPLLKAEMAPKYDVIVSESPYSANQKQKVFAMMSELLPVLASSGQPIPPEFYLYSPLPQKLARSIVKSMQPDPEEQAKQQQIQDQNIQLEFAEKKAKIEKMMVEAKAKGQDSELKKLELELEKEKLNFERRKATLEALKYQTDEKVAQADIRQKNASAYRDTKEAEAQEIENNYFRRGVAPPGQASTNG